MEKRIEDVDMDFDFDEFDEFEDNDFIDSENESSEDLGENIENEYIDSEEYITGDEDSDDFIEDLDYDSEEYNNSENDNSEELDFSDELKDEFVEGSVEEPVEEEVELTEDSDNNGGIVDLEEEIVDYNIDVDGNSDSEIVEYENQEDVVATTEGTGSESDEYSDEEVSVEDTESWFDEDEGHGEYAEDYEDAYSRISDEQVEDLESVYGFFDGDGNPIQARKMGTLTLDSVDISSVIIPTRNRTEPRDITVLEESIKNFNQVSPIHVIPYGDNEYILLDGLRRLHAMINLGHDKIIAYVDDTINYHAVRPFESLVNNRLLYTFSEKFKAGRFIEKRQDGFSYDTIENMVGLKTGEYLKMLFVHKMKDSFPDIYEKVILEKLTPEQAEKKINKELEKAEDENNLADSQSELGEEGEDSGGLKPDRESEDPYNRQNKEERSILDSSLKTAVLTRDGGVCQCCGEGIGEPEVSQLMKIHHIIPVELFGPDRQDNLITVCANCHDKVHYYDEGRYKPDGELPNIRRNPIILGNMIQELRDEAQNNNNAPIDGMGYFNESPYEAFILSSYQSDFIEDAEDNVDGTTRGEVHKVYTRRDRPKLKNTKSDMK